MSIGVCPCGHKPGITKRNDDGRPSPLRFPRSSMSAYACHCPLLSLFVQSCAAEPKHSRHISPALDKRLARRCLPSAIYPPCTCTHLAVRSLTGCFSRPESPFSLGNPTQKDAHATSPTVAGRALDRAPIPHHKRLGAVRPRGERNLGMVAPLHGYPRPTPARSRPL